MKSVRGDRPTTKATSIRGARTEPQTSRASYSHKTSAGKTSSGSFSRSAGDRNAITAWHIRQENRARDPEKRVYVSANQLHWSSRQWQNMYHPRKQAQYNEEGPNFSSALGPNIDRPLMRNSFMALAASHDAREVLSKNDWLVPDRLLAGAKDWQLVVSDRAFESARPIGEIGRVNQLAEDLRKASPRADRNRGSTREIVFQPEAGREDWAEEAVEPMFDGRALAAAAAPSQDFNEFDRNQTWFNATMQKTNQILLGDLASDPLTGVATRLAAARSVSPTALRGDLDDDPALLGPEPGRADRVLKGPGVSPSPVPMVTAADSHAWHPAGLPHEVKQRRIHGL